MAFTFTTLKTAIQDYTDNTESTFVSQLTRFILNADKDLLEMMLMNFLTNAIDAIELSEDESGVVEIRYENDGVYHRFFVYDSGIPIEKPEALFEAFSSTKVKGNGLGLILSKQIAQAHNGDVHYLADAAKKTFEITLKI